MQRTFTTDPKRILTSRILYNQALVNIEEPTGYLTPLEKVNLARPVGAGLIKPRITKIVRRGPRKPRKPRAPRKKKVIYLDL